MRTTTVNGKRTCKDCKKEFPVEEFPSYPFNGKRYPRSYCRDCMRIRDRKYYENSPSSEWTDEQRESSRKRVKAYRDRNRKAGKCLQCGQPAAQGKFCLVCKQKSSVRSKRQNTALKTEVFDAYGGRFCVCCGDVHFEFLSLDHIGGSEARKEMGHLRGFGGTSLYRKLRQQGFPPGFRVLCMNCNFAIGHFGYCPHDLEREHLNTLGE